MVNENSIANSYYVLPSFQIGVMTVTVLTDQSSYRRQSHWSCDVQELEKEGRKDKGKPHGKS